MLWIRDCGDAWLVTKIRERCVVLLCSHLSARRGSLLVPPPVKPLQHLLAGRHMCIKVLACRSHTHHQDLLTVWRLARNEGIVLQVCHRWHQRSAAAAPPAPPLPLQGSSQQSWAHCDGGGWGERRPGWRVGDGGGLQIWTVWNDQWPGRVGMIVKLSL